MFVPKLGIVILFVESPARSGAFYKKLLQREPLEASETFCLFQLDNGVQLGLWSRYTAEPTVTSYPATCEICFSDEHVDKVYEAMLKEGIPMLQQITDMDFGRTFVAHDPDGHRIRIYKLHEE